MSGGLYTETLLMKLEGSETKWMECPTIVYDQLKPYGMFVSSDNKC